MIRDFDPWADPQIRADYEAALGKALLAFNALENLVSTVVIRVLTAQGLPGLGEKLARGPMVRRIEILAALAADVKFTPDKPLLDTLLGLARERNFSAHGHFDQNPFSGEFAIVTAKGERKLTAPMLDDFTDRCTLALDQLRYFDLVHDFDTLEEDQT